MQDSEKVDPKDGLNCPVYHTLSIIGGKWKPLILYELFQRPHRFNELKRAIPAVTQRTLTSQLRALEQDGIINRDVKDQVPPHVEYSLTKRGKTLWPILNAMAEWGEEETAMLNRANESLS